LGYKPLSIEFRTSSSLEEAISPVVSVIVPCYNEAATIGLLLDALYQQTFPKEKIEILIADGMSTDGTRGVIASFESNHSDLHIKVIDNPKRSIPSGVNIAINGACGEYIIRMDAHSKPYPDYIERCVTALQLNKGDNVGGVWEIQPGGDSWSARAIASAASHPLAVGDARYRVGGNAQQVDTVPFGSFKRALVQKVGAFDENLLTNEDYEFNVRVRESGGVVWFDPTIRSIYFSRADFSSLARQYFRYGFWKGKMLQRYPGTIRWRQFLPPAFVLSILILALFSIFSSIAVRTLILELSIYLCVLLLAGVYLGYKKRQFSLVIGFPLAVATMHISWGIALLWSFVSR
jgi:succinoglycan biosynthesis protein ExoA